MATLNKSVLGKVSGRVGDLVFRQRGENNYISTRPAPFTPGTDEASVNRRKKFGFSVKLAKAINDTPELYQVWDESFGTAPYQNIVKANYPFIDPAGTAQNYKLVPQTGFGTGNPVITLSASEFQVEIPAVGDNIGIDLTEETTARLISLVYLHNPVDQLSVPESFLSLVSEDLPLQTTAPLLFSVPLMNQDTQMYNAYQNRDVYFVLVTLDADDNVIHFSNTFRNA